MMYFRLEKFKSIEDHKANYINKLEVVITEKGDVYYAHPSHISVMEHLACEKLGVTAQELSDMCPPEYYFNWMYWVSTKSKAIAVYNDRCCGDFPNKKQQHVIERLKIAGLYQGKIPPTKHESYMRMTRNLLGENEK